MSAINARRIDDERVSVLARRRGEQTLDGALGDLWREVAQAGWLAAKAPHILIQVGQRWRSSLVVDTARSLAQRLGELNPSVEVEVLDPAGTTARSADAATGTLTVHGIAAGEVRVPERWFSPFYLVTVTGAGPDPSNGLSAVLDAQAEPLARLGNALPPVRLAYEAHRLFASDLVVACTTARRDDPTSAACWFVGQSDAGVEMALIRASGGEPSRFPHLKTLARHEILSRLDLDDRGCSLSGYLAPAWLVNVNAARARLATSRQALVQDVISVRRNFHRIPLAIQRRLAMWRRSDE